MFTVGRPTSTNTFGIVFSTMWLESKDMAHDSLVRREPVSASCNRRPDEGLEPIPQGTSSQLSLTVEAQ